MKAVLGMYKEYTLILKLKLFSLFYGIPEAWYEGSKNPVVVIPGFHETFCFLKKIIVFLNHKGYPIHIITPFNSVDTISNLSYVVEKYITDNNLYNIILLTHSKGGVVAKYMMSNNPSIYQRIHKVIAIAAPFGGSILGHLHFENIYELKPNSSIITQLQSNTCVNEKFISLYPLIDNHVLPNNSSILKGAENVQVPVIGHTVILESDKTLEVLGRYL